MNRFRYSLPLITLLLGILALSACNPNESAPPVTFDLETTVEGMGTVNGTPQALSHLAGTEITLTAVAADGWTFDHWTGDMSGSDNPASITMDADKTITAVFTENPLETAELNLLITGQGTITTNPEPTSSSGSTHTYPIGTEVTLTAEPEAGHQFSGWLGLGALNDSGPGVTFTISRNMTATARFTQTGEPLSETFDLSTNVQGRGSINSDPEGLSYLPGTEVELTAAPDDGWTFDRWTGDLTGSDNPVSITMDADKSVNAVFTERPSETAELHLLADGQGSLTTTPEPTSSSGNVHTYPIGTEITLIAEPAAGHQFSGWLGLEDWNDTGTTVTFTISRNMAVTARFTQPSEVPGKMDFGVREAVEPSSLQLSDQVAVSGIETAVPATVTGDGSPVLLLNGDVVSVPVNVEAGDTLQVRLMAAAEFSEPATATVTVGGEPADFVVTTRAFAPITITFVSPPSTAAPGAPLVLSWTVAGDHDSLTLSSTPGDPGVNVHGEPSHSVQIPTDQPTVTYTLAASHRRVSGSESEASATVQIPLWVCEDPGEDIQVPDPALREAIEIQLRLTFPLTCGTARDTTSFGTGHSDTNEGVIESLVGMQHFTNLTSFDIQWNFVEDLTPLTNLTRLRILNLDKNRAADLSPLANLTNLRFLSLWDNRPTRDESSDGISSSDLFHLVGLTTLEELYLSQNNISSLANLSELTALKTLYLIGNHVEDLRPLSGMSDLQALRLGFNEIQNTGTLASLGSLVWLELNYNQVNEITALEHLAFLFSVNLEGNFLTDSALSPLLGNDAFPAEHPLESGQGPTTSELNVSYNCLANPKQVEAEFVEKGVVTAFVVGQRDACDPQTMGFHRQLRFNQLREGGQIR